AALAADYNRQALAQLGDDDWLMRSFVGWNEASTEWLAGRLGPAEDGLAEALDHATRGVALCRQLAFTASLAAGLAVLARIRHAQGDATGAQEAMAEA